MDINKYFQSGTFRGVLVVIGIIAAALIIFRAGVFVGYRKATFSYRWGENYHKNFGGPRGGFLMEAFDKDDFINPHGTFGKIMKIELPTFVVEGSDGTEKVILIKDDTAIRRLRDTVETKDLKVNDNVVIIGEPNDKGQVEAKLIRIMPSMPYMMPNGAPTK